MAATTPGVTVTAGGLPTDGQDSGFWVALGAALVGMTAYVHRTFASKASVHKRLDRIEDKLDGLIDDRAAHPCRYPRNEVNHE